MGNFKYVKWVFVLISLNLLNEAVALKNLTNQRIRSFHCVNGNYIFTSWFCDGINDCGDASDESFGCDQAKCGIGNFTCANSECLPVSVRCNGVKDCSDGSDENFCDHEPNFDDCKIANGKFLCKDKLRCVDLGRVCDEDVHCFDGSDEGGKCDDYDHEICNTCYHACYRTPYGPHCFYNQTTEEHHDISREIESCTTAKNYCDQKCVSFREMNQCSCEENFVPSYTFFQSFYCEEKDKSKNMLVYTTKDGIRGIPGYSNNSILIKDMKENITAIAAANEYVYWGGPYGGYKVIGKTSFNGSHSAVIVSKGIEDVTAMDVDWRTGDVYFIDNVRKHVAACSNDGKRCIEIHELEQIATSITLAPRLGTMFWAMHNDEAEFTIRKSEMNGQNNYDFVDKGIRDVSTLSADEAAEKLYWLDAVRRKIEMIRFDGSGRKIFKSDLRLDYSSLTVNARYLYWTVRNNGTIYSSPQNRILIKSALNGTDPVRLIYGYSHSEKTTKMERPCSWGCNGICLTHSRYYNKTGSDCVCENRTEVNEDGIWCRENSESFFQYNYEDHIFIHRYVEQPHRPLKMISVIVTLLVVTSGAVGYLYRKGTFNNLGMFRHSRL